MVSQAQHGVLVRCSGVFQFERVVIGQGINSGDGQIAGVAFFAVFAQVMEFQGCGARSGANFRFPDDLIEALDAAMQRVRAVIGRERILLAVQRELTFCDTVAIAPHERAEVWRLLQIAIQVVVPEHDISHFSVSVGNFERHYDTAVVRDFRLGPV